MLLRITILACFGAIAALGMVLLHALRVPFPQPQLDPAQWSTLGFATILSAHVVLLIHELGHVAGGWLAGYRLRELTVGPLTALRGDAGIRIAANRRLTHYGGLVRMMPSDAVESRARTALQFACGPGASILVGVAVTMIGVRWLADPSVAESGFRSYLIAKQFNVIGAGSIVVGLANLVPVTFGDRLSDGARLWQLLERSDT